MDFLSELLTFVLGVIASYLGLSWKIKKDLVAEHDRTLREARLRVYQSLWNCLEPLARYSRPTPVTFQTIKELSAQLRHWYFAEGGIYLSTATRDAYFELQEALGGLVDHSRPGQADEQELDDDTFERLRKAGSKLRTAMAQDVGTRMGSLLDPSD